MGRRRYRVAVVLLGVVLVTALAPTAAAQVTVDVTVDDRPVADGDAVTVTDDPVLGVDVAGNESIESVTIRVDGEDRHSFEPNATTFSERITLDLADGDHEVTVVVEGSERLTATIRKDSIAPLVTFTSPFASVGRPPTGEVAIDRSATTLAADLDDRSGVREVRIERTYEWRFAGERRRDLETYRIEDPGGNVSQPLLFGLGRNDLRVVAIDVHGQRRTYDVTVWVLDDERPTVDIDRFERTGGRLRVAGTVSDNVKVDNLSYRVGRSGGRTFVVNPTSAEPTRTRLDVDFAFTTRIDGDPESITLVATDVAGNTLTRELPLDYRGHLEPTVTVDGGATRADDGGVEVVGTVADGRVTRVVVESVGPDGMPVDSLTVYDGDPTSRVDVRGRIGAADGRTTVVIRAVDGDGREYRASLTLDTPGVATPTETATVTSTPTPTATPRATASKTADSTPTAGGVEGAETTSVDGAVPLAFVALAVLVALVAAAWWRRQ